MISRAAGGLQRRGCGAGVPPRREGKAGDRPITEPTKGLRAPREQGTRHTRAGASGRETGPIDGSSGARGCARNEVRVRVPGAVQPTTGRSGVRAGGGSAPTPPASPFLPGPPSVRAEGPRGVAHRRRRYEYRARHSVGGPGICSHEVNHEATGKRRRIRGASPLRSAETDQVRALSRAVRVQGLRKDVPREMRAAGAAVSSVLRGMAEGFHTNTRLCRREVRRTARSTESEAPVLPAALGTVVPRPSSALCAATWWSRQSGRPLTTSTTHPATVGGPALRAPGPGGCS